MRILVIGTCLSLFTFTCARDSADSTQDDIVGIPVKEVSSDKPDILDSHAKDIGVPKKEETITHESHQHQKMPSTANSQNNEQTDDLHSTESTMNTDKPREKSSGGIFGGSKLKDYDWLDDDWNFLRDFDDYDDSAIPPVEGDVPSSNRHVAHHPKTEDVHSSDLHRSKDGHRSHYDSKERKTTLTSKEEEIRKKKQHDMELQKKKQIERQKLEQTYIEEWDKHMEGFEPDTFVTFQLPSRTTEFFYHDVKIPDTISPASGVHDEPLMIKGGLFSSVISRSGNDPNVNFQITDPTGKAVFKKDGAEEALFHFPAKMSGTHTFMITNKNWLHDKHVTFTVGVGDSGFKMMAVPGASKPEHLSAIEKQITKVDAMLKDIQTESSYLWIRFKSHKTFVEGLHQRMLQYSLAVFAVLMLVSSLQVYYIKRLLSHRRIF